MIEINVRWKKEPFMLTAIGHAEAARNVSGHDLVCCAASTLIQTLGMSCAHIDGVKTTYHAAKASAFEQVLVSDSEAHWDELVPRFQMAIDGLTMLANQYPEHVSLSVED